MTPESNWWTRLDAVFQGALELPPAERPAYLDWACRADPDLRAEVEEMLAGESAPDALDLERQARAMFIRLFGVRHRESMISSQTPASIRRAQGDSAEAEALSREALATARLRSRLSGTADLDTEHSSTPSECPPRVSLDAILSK